MPIQTIVVALAFEDDSQRIAERAIQLANQHQAQLIGVHVMENLPRQETDLPPAIDALALAKTVREQSGDRLRILLAGADTPAMIQVETGRPHEAIQHIATSSRADLLVIGPGAAKNLREKVFGSTADRLVRYSSCPILIVRGEVTGPYARIAVGVDFSEHEREITRWIERLSPDAWRELIHAFQIPLSFEQAMLKAGTTQADIDFYRRARARTVRQQIMDGFSEQGRLPKNTRLRVIHGDAGLSLTRIARRKSTDLVALGTQRANAVAQYALGSVTRKVLAGARCDVLLVPARLFGPEGSQADENRSKLRKPPAYDQLV